MAPMDAHDQCPLDLSSPPLYSSSTAIPNHDHAHDADLNGKSNLDEPQPGLDSQIQSESTNADANLSGEIQVDFQIHADMMKSSDYIEDNQTLDLLELSDTVENCNGETELQSFERGEGIRESQDLSKAVAGIGESLNISTGAAKSELEHPHDLVEDVKGECESGVVVNEGNSERTQATNCRNGECYADVKGEEQESFENEVSLLEPSEGNKVEMKQHLAAAPSPLLNSEDVNGSISISTKNGFPTCMDQDDPLEAIDGTCIVANGTSFHDHTETSSGSVCDIATVETHKLSPTVLNSDPKVELNEITGNELEVVNHSEENSETASHREVDEYDKVEVLECTISGDDLPSALDESRISSVDDSVTGNELMPEEIEHVQSIETTFSSTTLLMDQDDPREAIYGNCIVANGISFHDHTETSSGSADCDIATVETRKLSPTVLISDPKVELNEITVNELEVVNHIEENSEMASLREVDEYDKVEVLECTISENGDDLPSALDESRIYSVDDSVTGNELMPEEIEHVQSIETTLSSTTLFMDQDDPREAIYGDCIVANGNSFHDHTETSSGSADCDIATVETRKLSPTVLISDPKVELNEITVNELEVVNHIEENSEMASLREVDEYDKVEVLECTISENGDDLPSALDEPRISSVDDSVAGSESIPEEIEHVQSIETTVFSVVIGNISIETRHGSSIHYLNGPVLRSDLEVEDCTMSENVASAGDDIQPDKEVGESQEIGLIRDYDSETKGENGDIEKYNESTVPSNDLRSKPNNCTSTVCEERGSIVSGSPNGVKKSSVIEQSSAVVTDSELHDNECNSSSTANEKSGCDIEITSSIGGGSRSIPDDDCTVSKTKVLEAGSVVNDEGDLNPMSDVAFETDGKPTKEVTEIVHEGCQNEPSPISPEGSVDALVGQNVGAEAGTRPFNFLVRVPRFDDGNIREQFKCAQTEVDRKTKDRDAIRVQIQTMRAAWKVLSDSVEAAVSEGRAARELLKSKRQEIDSVQSVLTKVKNAMSIEDIDVRIRNIDHMIEHETLPLNEEKQLIREIKQLKQLRDQLSSTIGKQEELQQALNQKDEIEERLKLLRKEMDSLRDNVLKAESVTKATKKKYNDESVKLDELQSQFKAADKIRQEAYANLQSMRKQLYEKNKYCWKYRDDMKEANEIASCRDVGRLQRLCIDQVERMMELWNSNSEFRDEYIKSNMKSTLRRLKTLDGRSLGPNEEPHVMNHIVKERPAMDNSLSTGSTTREPVKVIPTDNARDHDKAVAKVVETKKSKKPDTVVALVNGHRDICSENEVEETPRAEEIKRTREEEELDAKAEELRKEEKAIKLKEQRKLEEKAKAKEALERKKRIAEKAHARAVIKARKEAERRDKEREKRAKKKERKMGAETEAGNGGWEEKESAMITESENPRGKQGMVAENRLRKVCSTSQYNTKQSKTKLIPPPLRNRGGKRRMQPWMWVLLTTLTIVSVFLLFSTRSSSSSWLGF